MFRIKGQVQTSHLSKLQANRPKSHFRDKVIPILSFYRIQNQILSRQSHSNSSVYQTWRRIQTKISFSRQRSIQYFHFTKYKTKQVHLSCLQQGTSRTSSNFPFNKLRDMGHSNTSNTLILPNMKLNRFTYHVSQQGTSRKMVILHIYQTCNHIS